MKNTVVVYVSSNGTTEETVSKMKKGSVAIFDLKNSKEIDVSSYDRVLIGFGVYAGSVPRKISGFLKANSTPLAGKEVIFFIHGLDSENNHKDIIKACYPDVDGISNKSYHYLGGRVDIKKQNIFIKQLLKIIANKKNIDPNCMDNLNGAELERLINHIDTE